MGIVGCLTKTIRLIEASFFVASKTPKVATTEFGANRKGPRLGSILERERGCPSSQIIHGPSQVRHETKSVLLILSQFQRYFKIFSFYAAMFDRN